MAHRALAVLGGLVLLITFTPLTQYWAHWLTGPRWDSPAGDTLIILGGSSPVQPGNLPGYSSYWRSIYGLWAWQQAHYRQIIVSGDSGTAESMADFLEAHGVPRSTLRIENQSGNSAENVRLSTALLRDGAGGKIAILSSDFHMRRVVALFQKAGLRDFVILPVPDAGKRNTSPLLRWEVGLDLAAETAKLMWYRISGKI